MNRLIISFVASLVFGCLGTIALPVHALCVSGSSTLEPVDLQYGAVAATAAWPIWYFVASRRPNRSWRRGLWMGTLVVAASFCLSILVVLVLAVLGIAEDTGAFGRDELLVGLFATGAASYFGAMFFVMTSWITLPLGALGGLVMTAVQRTLQR